MVTGILENIVINMKGKRRDSFKDSDAKYLASSRTTRLSFYSYKPSILIDSSLTINNSYLCFFIEEEIINFNREIYI